ncbi:MAG: LCP family protein [Spirochaetes bacterium]|nr:LCP family protein [Spirochaetota bacterium]
MRRRNFIVLIVSLILILVLIYIAFLVTKNYYKISTIEKLSTDKNELICLVVGVDSKEISKGRTDTIFVVFFNLITKKVLIYSLPRDLRVKVSDPSKTVYDKINSVYSKYNISVLKETIESLLEISIPYYVIINYDFVSSLVDILGGIKIYIDKDMSYIDKAGGLYINLKKGLQILDGEKVLEYLRFRSDEEGDIGRLNRQINFLNVLLQRKKEILDFKNVPKVVDILFKKTKTNFTLSDVKILLNELEKIEISNFYYDTVLTKPVRIGGTDYLEILQKGTYDRERLKNLREFLASNEKKYYGKIRVEILNASNKLGLAKLLRNKLVYYNIDVIYFGNYSKNLKETVIIDRTGNLFYAKSIQTILRTGSINTNKNFDLGVDVTIILGEDFNIDNVD